MRTSRKKGFFLKLTSKTQRIILSFLFGIGIGAFPWFLIFGRIQIFPNWLGWSFMILGFPGMIAGLIAGANVHDPSIPVIIVTNSLLYGMIVYRVLAWWAHRKTRS